MVLAKITTSVDGMVGPSTSHRQCGKMWSLNPGKRKWSSGSYTKQLTNWSSAVEKVLLVQPSAERVFSILSASFNEQQDHAL